ncbi:MAG TPA: T9SS type A sorting domain-containing protein [Rhodospirillales bacterium]|nr:T9SS type A sorting domain-containing protein [Rhodospirillales bacterium]
MIKKTTDQKHHISSAIDQLLANSLNPFNPETWIPSQLSQDSTVTAKIYDTTGKLIRMIGLGHVPAENYVESNRAIYWDGKTDTGEMVASGTYFDQIEAGDYTQTRKMVILK